jgi:hypothetical protein
MGDFMVWGISGSDVSHNVWNLAVGSGIAVGCAVAAFGVELIAKNALRPKDGTFEQKETARNISWYLGVAAGLAATGAAYYYLPASRFALITDNSNSKAVKLGAAQAIAGFVADRFLSVGSNTGTVIGIGGALATRFGNVVVLGFGALGTAFGVNYLAR